MTFGGRIIAAGLGSFVLLCALCALLPGGGYLFGAIMAFCAVLAVKDVRQGEDPLLRNYPLVGRFHGLLRLLGQLLGLRQPLAPYSWAIVDLVHERAEGRPGISAFGAQLPPPRVSILHAMKPVPLETVPERLQIGGPACTQPYQASYLNISALAFGAVSEQVIVALSRGAKEGGFFYNTGEAGLPEAFFEGGGDLVWQLGTGYFSCRDRAGRFDEAAFRDRAAHPAIKMIEVKLSQGAKPAKGGLLPGEKVTARVAEVCQIPPGEDVILPAVHSAFSSPVELLEFLARLRDGASGKPVGFKLCVGQKVDVFAIIKAILKTGLCPDFISVDGAEGGTGAAPTEFQSFVGMPLRWALPFVRDALVGANLRDKVRVIASGHLVTGADMVAALAQGADLFAAARPFMLAMGCMQALICASNQCPTGIATQDGWLTRAVVPEVQALRVARFHRQTLLAFRELVSATGCEAPEALNPAHLIHEAERFYMEPGQLVAGEPPEFYAAAWNQADPSRF